VLAQRGALKTANLNVQYGVIHAPISALIGDTLVPAADCRPEAAQPLTTIVPSTRFGFVSRFTESQYLAFTERRAGSPRKIPNSN